MTDTQDILCQELEVKTNTHIALQQADTDLDRIKTENKSHVEQSHNKDKQIQQLQNQLSRTQKHATSSTTQELPDTGIKPLTRSAPHPPLVSGPPPPLMSGPPPPPVGVTPP